MIIPRRMFRMFHPPANTKTINPHMTIKANYPCSHDTIFPLTHSSVHVQMDMGKSIAAGYTDAQRNFFNGTGAPFYNA